MIIVCRKGNKAFSRLNIQPENPIRDFCNYIIETKIDKFHCEICLQIRDLPIEIIWISTFDCRYRDIISNLKMRY